MSWTFSAADSLDSLIYELVNGSLEVEKIHRNIYVHVISKEWVL